MEADGLGGFASGTVNGIRTRRYHAILLTATTPPAGRVVLVNGFEAWLEVQALWLNALRIGSSFSERWADVYARGLAAFEDCFWNGATGSLHDVIDVDRRPGTVDPTFRPNQIFAVAPQRRVPVSTDTQQSQDVHVRIEGHREPEDIHSKPVEGSVGVHGISEFREGHAGAHGQGDEASSLCRARVGIVSAGGPPDEPFRLPITEPRPQDARDHDDGVPPRLVPLRRGIVEAAQIGEMHGPTAGRDQERVHRDEDE